LTTIYPPALIRLNTYTAKPFVNGTESSEFYKNKTDELPEDATNGRHCFNPFYLGETVNCLNRSNKTDSATYLGTIASRGIAS